MKFLRDATADPRNLSLMTDSPLQHTHVIGANDASAFKKIVIDHPVAAGEIYLHGAHVTHWQPAGAEAVIYVSPQSHFASGKAIRGGVPICFPWFGPKPSDASAPAHGFVRTAEWALRSIDETGDAVHMHLRLTSNAATLAQWPCAFVADYRVIFGESLLMSLSIQNTGDASAEYTEALHTYLRVHDVREIRIDGLAGATYQSKADGNIRRQQGDEPITFIGETDRVYVDTSAALTITDEPLGRRIVIEKTGSQSTVIWNPFAKRAAEMADLGEANWPPFVCVESANALENVVRLAPGQSHELTTRIRVLPIETA